MNDEAGAAGPAPGLSAERTSLAWQRTALALLASVLAVGRLVIADLPLLGVALVTLAGPMTWALIWLARGTGRRPDGRLPALTAAVVLVIGLVELGHLASA